MSPARSLLSLPADVLLEILGLLLVDTPRLPHRAAIVQTCKLLHELGIPLLYRVIDLIKSDVCLKGPSTQCRTLFGVGGVLSLSRREGSFVREIRVSAAQTYMAEFSGDRQHHFKVGALNLSRCTSFTVEPGADLIGYRSFLPKLLRQITNLHDFHISHSRSPAYGRQPLFRTNSFYSALTNKIGAPARSAPLQTLTFSGAVWWDKVGYPGPASFRRLSLCDRAFKVLVIDLRESPVDVETDPDSDSYEEEADLRDTDSDEEEADLWDTDSDEEEADLEDAAIILDPLRSKLAKASEFLPEVRRIEFRVGSKLEEYLRTEAKRYEAAGLSAIQQRILPLIVFLDDDGTERRLIEQTTEVATA